MKRSAILLELVLVHHDDLVCADTDVRDWLYSHGLAVAPPRGFSGPRPWPRLTARGRTMMTTLEDYFGQLLDRLHATGKLAPESAELAAACNIKEIETNGTKDIDYTNQQDRRGEGKEVTRDEVVRVLSAVGRTGNTRRGSAGKARRAKSSA